MGHLEDSIVTEKSQSPKSKVPNSLNQEVYPKTIFFYILQT